MRTGRALILLFLSAISAGCGGGGGGGAVTPVQPPDPGVTVSVYYLRVDPSYDGWGLHLWGGAITASVATDWSSPRVPDRIENGAAVFEIPVTDETQDLNFIAHNGDLKSPIHDLRIVPRTFGTEAWIVQDTVAGLNGATGTPFSTEADALAALGALGNRSADLDLAPVVASGVDSGLSANWADSASFIEIYVRGYQDSDGDGVGDIQGLIGRLDYLQALGITGIWLMPVTESADNDHGYAVEDYRAIESDYGSMSDFETLLSEAHARGIAVIIDYVLNHAASTNPLFLDASTEAGNVKREWFVWESVKPQGWNTFAGDPWRNNGNGWYYGVFSALMPDFNLRNPEVVEYHKDNLRFWLNKGVDGFRFDAVGVLFENGAADWEGQTENHGLLAEMQALIDSYGKRFLVCESPSDPAAYASSASCGRAFAFQTPGAILGSARNNAVENVFVTQLRLPDTDRMPLILSNHDSFAGDRPWNQLNGDAEAYKLAAASYLLAARTPFTYYGEEVGMANAAGLSGDHALRTPMSWTGNTLTAGFSTVTPFRQLSANVATHNVQNETGDSDSVLEYYRELYRLRQAYPVIASGTLDVQSDGGEPVLRLTRSSSGARAVIVINYDSLPHQAVVATSLANATFDAVFGAEGQANADAGGDLTIDVAGRSTVVYIARP